MSLMALMVTDLDQCDVDRLELAKAKVEIKNLKDKNADLESKSGYRRAELDRLNSFNDSLMVENNQLNIKYASETKALRRGRNWWLVTAIAGVASAIIVHYHWKYAD